MPFRFSSPADEAFQSQKFYSDSENNAFFASEFSLGKQTLFRALLVLRAKQKVVLNMTRDPILKCYMTNLRNQDLPKTRFLQTTSFLPVRSPLSLAPSRSYSSNTSLRPPLSDVPGLLSFLLSYTPSKGYFFSKTSLRWEGRQYLIHVI